MSADKAAFGALLRELRLAKSLTIEALAEASGVSVRGIGALERGQRAAPQRRTVAALAGGLGLDDTEQERLLAAAGAGRAPGYSPVGVRSFPRGLDDFVGRTDELTLLEALVGPRAPQPAGKHGPEAARGTTETCPIVVAIHGAPGAGKTTFALRAARQLARRFPDGQFLVDLRGTDDNPPSPAELMVRVLKALGVPDRDLVKAGVHAHPAVYRQILADRRCLLVLDNAYDEAQVRPLLPGSGSTLALVTSRRMLTGLDGVHRLPLGRLEPAESAALLASLVGTERAAAEPEALKEVARLCGHLPLALRVAGNWLATRTGWSIRRLADRLAREERRLDALSAGDVQVTSAFDLSYRRLTPTAARLYRRLALVPGPDVGAACAARLTGQDVYEAEDTLEELVEAGLLGSTGDRYRLHDLLALYSRGRLTAEERAEDIESARRSMFRWLLETAIVAGRWYEPDRGFPPSSGQDTVDFPNADKAREWLQTEAANWLGALRSAAADGDHATVVEVAESLHWFSDQWIFWGHWPEVFGTAARSAEALGDPLLLATHLNYQAWSLLICEGRPEDSLPYSARALDAAREAGDLVQQAWAHHYAGWAHALRKDGLAGEHVAAAAELFEAAGDLYGMFQGLIGHGVELRDSVHDYEGAIKVFQQVLALLDETGDRVQPNIGTLTRVNTLGGLGLSYGRLERWEAAAENLRAAVELCRKEGNVSTESRYLVPLGDVLLEERRTAEAREVFRRCIALGPEADPHQVAQARSRLADPGLS
ncbi:ATP-binding protein [Streptomyces bauhiniae]|uniref:ATP-binding protein n=1 Tax=Streptomyces bauhiniae TaxID=2340725 RepID=UPI0035DB340F